MTVESAQSTETTEPKSEDVTDTDQVANPSSDPTEQAPGASATGEQNASDLPASTREPANSGRSVLTGAGAVVAAGLGLSSVTGTTLSDMLHSREEIIGQIAASTGGGGDPVEAAYGAPWHAAAVVNGVFALLAVLLGGALLAAVAGKADTRAWVRALAFGGVLLGVVGLIVSAGMYFDLFAAQPTVPAQPAIPPGAGG
jgi:hypothetical protein